MNKSIGNTIKSLRKEKGLSQLELSKRLGIHKSTLSLYESGQRIPNEENKRIICDYFDIDMGYLYGDTDVRNKAMTTVQIFEFLTPEELDKVIEFARFIINQRDQNE